MADAKAGINSNSSQTATSGGRTLLMARRGFWHSSYVEDYYSWLGHGYHIHLSSRDCTYVEGMQGAAAAALAGGLAAASIVTGGAAVVIGAILAGAILTLYWRESNSDGSIDVWSPDILRLSFIRLTPGVSVGTSKVGRHWYPISVPGI